MKVLDLHTGETVDLPPRMAPGRYRLLSSATLNATVTLDAGDVLWSDGGTRCDLLDVQGKTWQSAFELISADQVDAWQLVDQGVLTVVKLVEAAAQEAVKEELPAPLMPSNLTDFVNPSAFEVELQRVLDAGHLHEISARPRMSMRYESTVQPVSRARRLASGALDRLAARSEDWHRRTLGGVEPARVLAEVSEDDWGIYENIVFARLIDQAIRLVSRRERAVALLTERQSSALKLSQAEDLNYRLREKLCKLWGQASEKPQQEDKPQQEVNPLHTRLNKLKKMGQRLRQLRFGSLYQAIPRAAHVPIALKNTNVLTHDPHYREIRALWQLAHQGEWGSQIKPEEKIRQRMAQHKHYDTFVGLLTRHALKDCRTLKPSEHLDEWRFAGAKLTLQHPQPCEWLLSLAWPGRKSKTLTFLAAWSGQASWQESVERSYTQHECQPVYCHSISIEDGLTETGEDGVLNPLQFYAVERIKQRIENWLYQQVIALYPLIIPTMPTRARDELLRKAPRAFVVSNNGLRIVGNVKNFDVIELARNQGTNESTLENLSWGLDLVASLEICRVCGEKTVPTTDPVQSTFWVVCACGYEWGITKQGGRAEIVFRFKYNNEVNNADFRRTGSWTLTARNNRLSI